MRSMTQPAWACTVLLFSMSTATAQLPETLEPGKYGKPSVCPTGYDFVDATSPCRLNDGIVMALKLEECGRAGFKFENGKCSAQGTKAPSPECAYLPGYTPKVEAGACSYKKQVPTSAPGQFVNDCLVILSPPAGSGLVMGGKYAVTEQVAQTGDDSLLSLAPGEIDYFPLHCKQLPGAITKVLASDLLGATRRYGYTWGVLSMPYKWFPKQKAFVTGAPIGAYVGWREAQAASGTTYAVAATLSSVKADTFETAADGLETVTGSTEVSALSLAVGVIWDISKDKRSTPFKAGVFIGSDMINEAPGIRYLYNRKTYVAIQIGYNFTDN
jgi:hypothetical protein